MRTLAAVLAILVLSALALFAYLQGKQPAGSWICQNGVWVREGNPAGSMPTSGCGTDATSTATSTMIIVNQPQPGETIASPVRIAGEARGNWYFEASFPISLYDGSGKLLAQMPAQAQGEWMTTEFVPFSVDMSFPLPSTATGTLVLEKDNPSGLPENAAQVSIPVKFEAATSTSVIKVFFGNSEQDPQVMDCNRVFPTERTIARTPAVARKALEELLAGPTREEQQKGFFSSINSGVTIQRLVIENGTAQADFSKRLEEAVGGSCRVAAIRAQVTETLKQFPTVQDVIISIDGRTEDILQP